MTAETLSPWAHKLPQELQRNPTMDPKARFYRQFHSNVNTLQELISQLPSFAAVGGERQDAIEHILAGIARLSTEVADAADFVPAYDQRTYAQTLKTLTDELNETTAKFAPKTRFQFKPRTVFAATANTNTDSRRVPAAPPSAVPAAHRASEPKPAVTTKDYNAELRERSATAATTTTTHRPSFSAAREIVLSGHAGLHIVLPATAARATSAGALTDLRDCVVDMSAPTVGGAGGAAFAGLALRGIARSLVVAGRVDGAVHVTGVRDSVVVVAARQVRVHECENVSLYLHCGSHPIIEDCKEMRFAPAPACYLTEKEDTAKNQWDQVDDFKWLKTEHSPNWSVLPDGERIADDVWKNTVPGGPGVSAKDILKAVGIGSS